MFVRLHTIRGNAAQAAEKTITAHIEMDSQLGTTKIEDDADADARVVIDGLEDDPDQNAPGAGFTYSWSIASTKSRTDPNAQWQTSQEQASVTDDDAPTATVSTSFNNAAYYQILVKVNIDFDAGTGDDTWHGEDTITILQTAVGIEKIQYKLNGTWTDFPIGGLSDICKSANINFKVIIAPTGATWPTGKPEWEGDATGTGEEKAVTFSTAGARTVSAKCGNTVTLKIGIVNNPVFSGSNATVSRVTPAQYRISLGPDTYGLTYPESLEINISACHDTNYWHAMLVDLEGNYSLRARLLPPNQHEVTGPPPAGNTTVANSCPQAEELHALGYDHVNARWYMLDAVIDHEEQHELHFKPAIEDETNSIESEIESLKVIDTGQSKAEAITQLKALVGPNGWEEAIEKAYTKWLYEILTLAEHDHDPGGVTETAEHAVVDPMVSAICNWRAAQVPPLTGCAICND